MYTDTQQKWNRVSDDLLKRVNQLLSNGPNVEDLLKLANAADIAQRIEDAAYSLYRRSLRDWEQDQEKQTEYREKA